LRYMSEYNDAQLKRLTWCIYLYKYY